MLDINIFVNIKSHISKSPLQKYTFVLEFQTEKLYSAYNYSASFQNSGASRRWPARGLFQTASTQRGTRQRESRTRDFLSVRLHRLWLRSIRQCAGRKLDWVCGSGMQCNNAMSVENDSQSWGCDFFSFVLLCFFCFCFLTKCYRTMRQS